MQPSTFLLYCRISGDFNQGSLSSLSFPFSLLRYCTEQEALFIFPFQLCSRANWRVRMQELDRQFQYPERETLVLSTIILYDGRLQLVARANKTLRQHRKRNFENGDTKQISQAGANKQTHSASFIPLQL